MWLVDSAMGMGWLTDKNSALGAETAFPTRDWGDVGVRSPDPSHGKGMAQRHSGKSIAPILTQTFVQVEVVPKLPLGLFSSDESYCFEVPRTPKIHFYTYKQERSRNATSVGVSLHISPAAASIISRIPIIP